MSYGRLLPRAAQGVREHHPEAGGAPGSLWGSRPPGVLPGEAHPIKRPSGPPLRLLPLDRLRGFDDWGGHPFRGFSPGR